MPNVDKRKLLKWINKEIKESVEGHGIEWEFKDGYFVKDTNRSLEVEWCDIAYGYQNIRKKIKRGDFDAKEK